MKKKFIITLISVCTMIFAFGMINVSATSSGTCGDNLIWTLENGTLTISGQGNMTDWYISSSYAPWYSIRENITNVVIENGINNIGDFAFYNCNNLVNVEIPDSVTNIDDEAFSKCSSLKKVNITDLEAWCNIIFESADNTSCASNPLYYAEELYLNDKLVTNLIIPDSVSIIRDFLFYKCKSIESVIIPDSVTTIGWYAFYSCEVLQSVTIGSNVTSIGIYAFRDCTNLISVTIPNSVNSIGNCAFYNCSSLTDVYYNGTQWDWNEITIGTSNSNLKDAQRHYFLYVTYIDENGEIIREDIATSNTTIIFVVLPELSVKEGYEAKFYVDEAYTIEFNPSIQIVENTTIYVKTLKKLTPYTINSVAIKDMSGNNLQAIPTGTFLATVSFTNVSSNADTVIILAQYTDDGAFKGLMYIQTEDVPTGSTIKLSIPVDNSKGDVAKLKAFSWESFNALTPMGNSASFPAE